MGPSVGDPAADLAVVVKRVAVLRTINDLDDPALDEVTGQVEYTRSHTNRIVNRLREAGLLSRSDSNGVYRYSLTFLGRQLLAWYDHGYRLCRAAPLFEAFPPDTTLPVWVLHTGEMTIAEGDGGYRLMEPIVDFIESADRFRVAAPTLVRRSGFERAAELALAGDLAIEMVFPTDFFAGFYETVRDRFRRLVREADVSVHTTDDPLPYGFAVGYDDGPSEMSAVCYNSTYSAITGVLRNDSRPAIYWALDRFEGYLANATDLTDDIRSGSISSHSG